MKRLAKAFSTLLLAILLASLAFSPAGASAAQGKLKVRVLQKKQQAILKHGLQVKVVSKKRGKVKLRSFSSTFDESTRALTKKRTERFRHGGSR
jgi:ABC-type metal ion transport system substrate-binding protein